MDVAVLLSLLMKYMTQQNVRTLYINPSNKISNDIMNYNSTHNLSFLEVPLLSFVLMSMRRN